MAESLSFVGLAANIVQCLNIGTQLISALQSAPHWHSMLAEDIRTVEISLNQAAMTRDDFKDDGFAKIAEDSRRFASELLEELKRFERRKVEKRSMRSKNTLPPAYNKTRLERLAKEINNNKRHLSIVLLRVMRQVIVAALTLLIYLANKINRTELVCRIIVMCCQQYTHTSKPDPLHKDG